MNAIPKISSVTLFPKMFEPFFAEGVLARAAQNKIVELETVALRNFSDNARKSVDDSPFGGGDGMVLLPNVCEAALKSVLLPESFVVEVSPRGKIFSASAALHLAQKLRDTKHLVFLCGRYAGFDERFSDQYVDESWSVGDFVISGGEFPALFMMDAILRHIPGVLGNEKSAAHDSHSDGLLEAPSYTKPNVWNGHEVPQVLLSGDHKKINNYRRRLQILTTAKRRPDLIYQCWNELSPVEKNLAERVFKNAIVSEGDQ